MSKKGTFWRQNSRYAGVWNGGGNPRDAPADPRGEEGRIVHSECRHYNTPAGLTVIGSSGLKKKMQTRLGPLCRVSAGGPSCLTGPGRMGSPFARIPKLNVAGYRSWTAWVCWAGVGSGSHRLPLPRRKVIPGGRTKSACKTAGPRDALVPAQKVQPHRRRWATEASTRQRCVEATDAGGHMQCGGKQALPHSKRG